MEHREWKRIVPASDTAVLFIHGIAGTPNHFSDFVELVPENLSVWNLLLDGHGKGAVEFSKTSMKRWETQVQNAVEELSQTHEYLYIVGHSMGTLFAIEQAIRNPKITKLFLLAVPLKLFLKSAMVSNAWKVYFDKIKPGDASALAAKKCYGIENDKMVLHYLGWIPRFMDLFAKIRQTRKRLHLLNTPTAAFQSMKDEMVSSKTMDLLRENPSVSVTVLPASGHYYYPEEEYGFLLRRFAEWMCSY